MASGNRFLGLEGRDEEGNIPEPGTGKHHEANRKARDRKRANNEPATQASATAPAPPVARGGGMGAPAPAPSSSSSVQPTSSTFTAPIPTPTATALPSATLPPTGRHIPAPLPHNNTRTTATDAQQPTAQPATNEVIETGRAPKTPQLGTAKQNGDSSSSSEKGSSHDGEPMFDEFTGGVKKGGGLDVDAYHRQLQMEHGDSRSPEVAAGETFPIATEQGTSVDTHAEPLEDTGHDGQPNTMVTPEGAESDRPGEAAFEIPKGTVNHVASWFRHVTTSIGLKSIPHFWPAHVAPVAEEPSPMTTLSTSIRDLSAVISDLSKRFELRSSQESSQDERNQSTPQAQQRKSAIETDKPNPSYFSASMDAMRAAEDTIHGEVVSRKAGYSESEELSAELQLKMHAFAEAVGKQAVADRFDDDMVLIICNAVHHADHFWTKPQPVDRPRLVPESTVLGEALLSDFVGWQAKTASGIFTGRLPTVAHRMEVDEEMADFMGKATAAGKQTELAHLAFLLWSDAAIHHVLTLDDMREKIDLAFGGHGTTSLDGFSYFYAKPGLTIEAPSRLAQAEAIWAEHV